MFQFLSSSSQSRRTMIFSLVGVLISIGISLLTYLTPIGPVLVVVSVLAVLFVIFLFRDPSVGLIALFIYCFTFGILTREVGGIAYGIGVEVLLLLTWISVIIQNKRYDWKLLNNALVKLTLVWFIISVMEVANPAGASVMGWLQEIRSTALLPMLLIPLVFLLFDSEKKMNMGLILLLALSLFATLNGLKQQHIGLSPGEQRFLADGGAETHLLWGKLRVFSFYSDSGQFGASQASFVLIAAALFIGPFKSWKRALAFMAAALSFYGMLISGTRGALFTLIVGGFFILGLAKDFKLVFAGGILIVLFVAFLKFTTIGNSNYEIFRLRSAVNPKEASLNVRFKNQRTLARYLKDYPFGGGLGTIGKWGKEHNKGKFLSTIEPDSYWVKVWAMYGIVGMTLWFSMVMYLLGICSGIIWKLKDQRLRYKGIAMIAAASGLFFCSYGNEVMNSMPSSIVYSVCLTFIFLCRKFDGEHFVHGPENNTSMDDNIQLNNKQPMDLVILKKEDHAI